MGSSRIQSLPADQPITHRPPTTAWALLLLTALFWGGNVVASRSAVGELSPMALITIRWAIVSLILLACAWRPFVADLPVMRQHMLPIWLMAFFGFTCYQALYFSAAHATSGMHLAILQGIAPAFVFAGARIFYGTPIGAVRGLGLLLTMVAVLIVASHGEPMKLLDMDFNIGDAAMVLAALFYASYTVALRKRPPVSAIAFFTMISLIATVTSAPLLAAEMIYGAVQWPTTKGWIVLAYIVIFPSLLAQVFFIRGVGMIGPGRASLFYNLVPVLGAIMAVTILGEPFAAYHALGLALALGGVFIAETFGGRRF